MAVTTAVVIGVGEAGGGIAAVVGGGLSTIGTIAAGAAIAGGVASAIGAATGNSALAKIGGIVGAAGGLATGADLLTSLSTPTDIASAVPASTTQAAMSTSGLNALTNTTQTQSPGLLDNLLNSAQKNPLLAAQVGSGVIGGIANYLAPSPAQKAQIALENAETQRQQQIISLTAQRNANIAAGASQPQFKPGVVNPNTPAPSTTGSPGIGMPSLNNAPGNAYSLNNSPTANPGLLANAGAPVGS